jgi:hypothetical protein
MYNLFKDNNMPCHRKLLATKTIICDSLTNQVKMDKYSI